MNTDNMSMAGETIDYGPCAFMDVYHPQTVYSSIDQMGRYASATSRASLSGTSSVWRKRCCRCLQRTTTPPSRKHRGNRRVRHRLRDGLRRGPQPQARPVPTTAGRSIPGTRPPRAHGPQWRGFHLDLPPAVRRGCQPRRRRRCTHCLPIQLLRRLVERWRHRLADEGGEPNERRTAMRAADLLSSRATIWWRRRSRSRERWDFPPFESL